MYPRALSVGQKQRVAIARATVHAPGVVLCDEPTAALDRETAGGVMELLRAYAGDGGTVVVVTHDRGLIRQNDDVWSIDGGRLGAVPRAGRLEADEVRQCA